MNLVERLAAKLDISVDRADHLLEQYLQEIRRKLDRGETVELPGMGTFRQTSSGGVEFEPDAALADIVNYRFAGLSTVEASPPSAAEASEQDTERAVPTATETPSDEPVTEDTPADREMGRGGEPLEEEVDRFWDEQRTDSPLGPPPDTAKETSYSIVDDGDGGETEEGEETGETGEGEEGEEELQSVEAETSGEDVEDESAGSEETPGRATFPRKPRSSDNGVRRTLGLVAGLLITSGVVLLMYFAWFRGRSTTQSASTETTEQQTTVRGATADSASAAQGAPSSTSSTSGDVIPQGSETAGTDGATPFDTPLRSSSDIQPTHGGYAWIVASVADRATAKKINGAYVEKGYRTAIFRGGNGYRVAVGQFETIEDVLATRGDLPEVVAARAWVLRIDSNISPSVSS